MTQQTPVLLVDFIFNQVIKVMLWYDFRAAILWHSSAAILRSFLVVR